MFTPEVRPLFNCSRLVIRRFAGTQATGSSSNTPSTPITPSDKLAAGDPKKELSTPSVTTTQLADATLAKTTGVPDEHIYTRRCRISRPSKNVMQSGTNYMQSWKVEFDSRQRWSSWLMGWGSSADPLSNLSMTFPSKEQAIAFCDKNNWYWFVEEQPERKVRRKSYADNFAWNKRTRLGSK